MPYEEGSTEQDILDKAKKQFAEIVGFESDQRSEMEDDKRFGLGIQWDTLDRSNREGAGRPCITILRTNQFTDHIKNQQRQNKPAVKVSPVDEGADEEIADRRQGLIRHIQYESKAQMARQQAFNDAVDMGRGHYVVKSEYVSARSFDQKITVEVIKDPLSVYMSLNREKPDYSDCTHGFIVKQMSKDEFQDKYPDADESNWDGSTETDEYWITQDRVQVAEYYCKKYKKRKLVEVKVKGSEETRVLFEDQIESEDYTIVKSRMVEDPYWMWYKMTGVEILDETELASKEMPIITVIGKEDITQGDWSCKGLMRDIKDPQRLYNFLASQEAELINMAPRSPWIMAEGQDEGYEDEWANSNIDNLASLTYKPKTFEGHLLPPPQRNQFAGVPIGIVNEKQEVIEDMKAITGIYDASIGNRSNETSGVAIRQREAQSNNANYHFIDNFSSAITHEGRVINSMIPVVYDTHRTVTYRGDDDEEELMEINKTDDDGFGGVESNFNVVVSVGPSFNTQREEQAAAMMELATQNAMVVEGATDLVIKTQDWHGKDELSNRIKHLIDMKYPGLTQQVEPEADGENAELIMMQQQLQQTTQQLQQVTQQAQQIQQALDKSNADKNAADAAKAQHDLQLLELKQKELLIKAEDNKAKIEVEHKKIKADMMAKDLEVNADIQTNKNDNETKLIGIAQSGQQEATKPVEQPKAEKPAKPPVQNVQVDVHTMSKKKSTVKKLPNGDYTVETEAIEE